MRTPLLGQSHIFIHISSLRRLGGQPGQRNRVWRNQPGLRAQLGAHVGQRHALVHGQRLHRSTAKFNRLVLAAVHAEAGNHVQHHVLGANAGSQPAIPAHAQGARHAQPDLAGHHHAQHFGAADTKHVGTKSPAGGRMRVTAHTEHTGADVALLRHHHMANALAVIHMGQVLLARPVARNSHNLA